jgi:hypothetical protein
LVIGYLILGRGIFECGIGNREYGIGDGEERRILNEECPMSKEGTGGREKAGAA